MSRLICWAWTVVASLRAGLFVSGHDYVEVERNPVYQTLACERCGHLSRADYGPEDAR